MIKNACLALVNCAIIFALNYTLTMALGLWLGSAIWIGIVAIWFKRADRRRTGKPLAHRGEQ